MDREQAIETQRRRLLRLVAGLIAAVGFLSVGPVSRSFSVWACGFVGSILSRTEAAVRYLVIAEARGMMAGRGVAFDCSSFTESLSRASDEPEAHPSFADCRARLRALQAVLTDLPRHALRLVRRIEKQNRRAVCADRPLSRPDALLSAFLCTWRLAENRTERPPDKVLMAF